MEFINTCETSSGLSGVVRPPNVKTDEKSQKIQADEVSEKIEPTSNITDGKSMEKPSKDQKIPQDMKQPDISNLPGVVDCPSNLNTGENSMVVRVGVASNNLKSSHGKVIKKSVKDQGLSLKRKKSTKKEEPSLKRKKTDPVPTSQMVIEAIKALRKRNGASVEDILQYIESRYKVDVKLVRRYVTRYLQSAVQKGALKQLSGVGENPRYKIKKPEKIAKIEKKPEGNQKKVKKGEKVTKTEQKSKVNQKMMKKIGKVAKVVQQSKVNQKMMKKTEEVAKVYQKSKVGPCKPGEFGESSKGPKVLAKFGN